MTNIDESTTDTKPPSAPPRPKGFAAMSPETLRKIAVAGGKAAHAKGTAHRWDAQEARAAGKAGGNAVVEKLGWEHLQAIGRRGGVTTSKDREHMSEIGRRGGVAVSGDRERMRELGQRSAAKRLAKKVEAPR